VLEVPHQRRGIQEGDSRDAEALHERSSLTNLGILPKPAKGIHHGGAEDTEVKN
jgi:hypothetical protein